MRGNSDIIPTASQAAALDAVIEWYRNPNNSREFYLAGYAGTGKTTLARIALERLGVRFAAATLTGKAAHVLRRRGVPAGTIHSLIYTPVDQLDGSVEFELNPNSDLRHADLALLDECFVKNTNVNTLLGKKPIYKIKPGELIFNANGVDRVVDISKKEVQEIVNIEIDGGRTKISCSKDHRFFTARGIVFARNLQLGDRLAPTREAMRLLQNSIQTQESYESVLLPTLYKALVASYSRIPRTCLHRRARQKMWCEAKSISSVWDSCGFEANTKNTGIKSVYRSQSCSQNTISYERTWSFSKNTERREWETFTKSSNGTLLDIRRELDSRICSKCESQTAEFSNSLQNRYCEFRKKDSNRSGWAFSYLARKERKRREKRYISSWPRVDSLEIYESRDFRLDKEREIDGKLYLYDLKIEKHQSYSVDGILVHNCSMVSKQTATDLRSFGKPLLVLGDPAQLPPIAGAGAFTSRESDYLLTEVHRQAAESPILRLATLVREGRSLPTAPYEVETLAGSIAIRHATQKELLRPDTQVLCGTHRTRWKATAILRAERGIDPKTQPDPLPGERVICTQNDREEGLFNGMLGTVLEVSPVNKYHLLMSVALDDDPTPREVVASRREFLAHQKRESLPPEPRSQGITRWDFAYVITVHKAQGSEWDNITLINDSASFREDAQRWLYTGITRASRNLTILSR